MFYMIEDVSRAVDLLKTDSGAPFWSLHIRLLVYNYKKKDCRYTLTQIKICKKILKKNSCKFFRAVRS